MQELLAELLPWVLGFYAIDGIVQLRRGHILAAGTGALRPLSAGLRWLGLSPFAEAVTVFDLPWLRGSPGLWVFDARRKSEPAVVEAVDLQPIDLAAAGPLDRTHQSVTAGETTLFLAPSPSLAAALMARLASGGAKAPGPATLLRRARALRLRLRPYRVALRVLAGLLAALLLVAAPLAVWSPLSVHPMPLAAFIVRDTGLLLVVIAATGCAYLRAAGERWWRCIGGALELLLPWAALHPLTHLSRSLYRHFDAPTALAAVLPAKEFHAWAGRELVRARLSRERTPAALAPAWERREALLARLLTSSGTSADIVLAPPPREADASGYCPLCRTVYGEGVATCADCGVGLAAFGPVGRIRAWERQGKHER